MILNNFNGQKETLLGLCKSERVFLWKHLVKRESPMDARYKFPGNPFLQRLGDFYCDTFNGERSFRTDYFLTIGIPYDDIDAGEKKLKISSGRLKQVLKTTIFIRLGSVTAVFPIFVQTI